MRHGHNSKVTNTVHWPKGEWQNTGGFDDALGYHSPVVITELHLSLICAHLVLWTQCLHPLSLSIKTLMPNAMVFGDGALVR